MQQESNQLLNYFEKGLAANNKTSETRNSPDKIICMNVTLPRTDQQFIWYELYLILRNSVSLQQLLLQNLDNLFISKPRFEQLKHKKIIFEKLVQKYQSRNCLKAISAIVDLSHLKLNQYKFLFTGFPLGLSVRLLIRESVCLYKSLPKSGNQIKEYRRLLNHWINYLMLIKNVPQEIHDTFRNVIFDTIELNLKIRVASF